MPISWPASSATCGKSFAIDIALGGKEALALMKERGPYAVVVADMQMPGIKGIQFLQEAESFAPDTVRIMLTGNADQKTAMDAVNRGHVFRFLTKPCPPEELAFALKAGVKQYQLVTAEREVLEKTLNGAIAALTGILATMDPVSFGVGEMLRDDMRRYARFAQLREAWSLELAAMLSKIGHMAIPVKVLVNARSGAALRPEEREMLARVARTGADLLANIPRLESVAEIVLYQGKLFSGAGFPSDSVAGNGIPLGARILKILGDLIELEAKGKSRAGAITQLRSRTGWYDPDLLDSIAACFEIEHRADSTGIKPPRDLQLLDLISGDVFTANVETNEGTLLAVAGTVISPLLIEKLRNFDRLVGLKRPLLVQKRA